MLPKRLENLTPNHYIQYMRKKTMARPRKSKIADTIRHHENVEIRLMAIFLEDAMAHAMSGDLIRAMANLRNAAEYEKAIPNTIKNDLYAEHYANA
jgi:hypothetical protein